VLNWPSHRGFCNHGEGGGGVVVYQGVVEDGGGGSCLVTQLRNLALRMVCEGDDRCRDDLAVPCFVRLSLKNKGRWSLWWGYMRIICVDREHTSYFFRVISGA
jgi:hypothetical protein